MVKDRGWENAQRPPQLFRQGAAPQGAADHPDRSWKEKDIPNRPSKKMRPQGRLKLKLSLSTSTSHLNSKEGNIHTQDHHVINSEEKSSSKEEKESDSEKRQTNKPKKETSYESLEEVPRKNPVEVLIPRMKKQRIQTKIQKLSTKKMKTPKYKPPFQCILQTILHNNEQRLRKMGWHNRDPKKRHFSKKYWNWT